MSTAEQIREAAERGRTAIAARQLENKKAHAQYEDERRAAWADFDSKLVADGIPQWALEYIERPDGGWPDNIEAIRLHLPGCAPILLLLKQYHAAISYMVDEPLRIEYDYDSDQWYVDHFRRGGVDGGVFDVAVAQAEAWGESYHEMATEAARRNEQGIKPEPRVPLRQRIAAVDPAEQIVNILDGMLHTQAEAGPLWAALSIGMELRGIRTALEDIAAALLVPVDDDLVITE